MDSPTPTSIPTPIPETPEAPSRSRRRTYAIAGVAGAVAVAGLGIPALASSGDDDPADRRPAMVEFIEDSAGGDLGDVTLDDLAGELEALGLELRVTPSGGVRVDPVDDVDQPTLDDTADDVTAPTGDGDEAEPAVSADTGSDDGDAADDPFAGMTDAEIDALSDEEFWALLDEAGWTVDEEGWIVPEGEAGATGTSGGDHDHDHDSFGDETAAVFSVDGDAITQTSGDADAARKAEAIWNRFTKLIPADQRAMLVGFELMAEEGAGGYVYPDESDPTKWHMGIAPGLNADEDFVLIHEFAHLLTLQAKEVPPSFDDGSCATYHTGEGCSLKGSTMAEFVARFWPKAQQDEVFAAQEAEDWDAIDAFYAEHRDDFVTDYATTNPAEDLAETFTIFVLEDRPTGDTIADQKIQFLWDDPDLVELREKIRAAM